MVETPTICINAPSLGAEVLGALDNDSNIALFRGIPYANVSKRWTHSVTRHSLKGTYNATQFGPRCNQGNGMVLVTGGTNDPTPGDDEFKCLNLNIAVPNEALGKAGSLPVMVWIHGGGFAYGANSVARYRPQSFLAHARNSNTPVILVQMNYRLGALGFSASTDLATEVDGSIEPVGNYGIVDQRNALEWVNQHIADFGGDPNNITVFGVSAGSASIHAHLLAGHELFDRAIMMSGAAPTLFPVRSELFEEQWNGLCERAGAVGSTPSARLEHLRSLDVNDILKYAGQAVMGPAGDGKLIPKTWSFDDNVSNARCKSIILGDTNVEALIFDGMLRRLTQEKLHEAISRNFPDNKAKELCHHFGFSQGQSAEAFRDAFRLLLGSVLFQYPNIGIAEASRKSDSWKNNVFLYHWEEPSPFPGATQGMSYHGLCALLMHLNELDSCPQATRDVSLEAARLWAAFAHGQQPWEAYSTGGQFMRFGPEGKTGLSAFAGDHTRAYGYLEWLGENFDDMKRFIREDLMYHLENGTI
ncbi:uncharacterized protein N7484_003499 [Penicillium longicatenatum]|uniref:uncharacterized protein n=1 Tax=Penicillium longicatenatum TaxID=1561947 RepID=UPI0025498889|nr:uncharacterized protein N7484_003499 [Penicillium longicatenatum]KAJ5649776.1 hypothetical protein N7484_003499 [Penicillium longicatenatum]